MKPKPCKLFQPNNEWDADTPDGTCGACGQPQRLHPKNRAAVALGRRGGRKTSPQKAAAAHANGQKGGRPTTDERIAKARYDALTTAANIAWSHPEIKRQIVAYRDSFRVR